MKDRYKKALMDMACVFGETSYAERLKVGSLIFKNDSVVALGCNGQPPGWHTEVCEDEKGNTLPTVRHSEDAALQKLWNSSETAKDAEMFISHQPCLSCSIKIVTAGIRKVYYRHEYRCSDGIEYLLKNGVRIEKIN